MSATATIRARAAVALSAGSELEVREVTLRDLGDHEVLIENRASGMCHTDLSVSQGHLGLQLPIIPGHEGSGIVLAVGADVSTLAEGDHVVVALMPECGRCRACLSSRSNACETAADLRSEPVFSMNGVPLPAMSFGSTFATHAIAPETAVVKVPRDVPFDVAGLMGCGVATGVGAVRKVARAAADRTVVVFGLGSIGLNVVQAARLQGARSIIAIDGQRHRRNLAAKFGATELLDPVGMGDKLAPHILEATGGGADYVFECVGSVAVLHTAVEVANLFCGTAVAVGAIPFSDTISLPGGAFLLGRKLLGTFVGDVKPRSEMPALIHDYQTHDLNIDDLITAHITLEQVNEGFEMMRKGAGVRTVITY